MGCNGGNVSWAYKYLKSKPLGFEKDYPYTSGTGTTGTCNKAAEADGCATVVSYQTVKKNTSTQLVAAVG